MKIGLYFGSFNPIHSGHLVIAGYMAEFSDLKQVWMVVSPHNPLKPAGTLLQDYHRFHLVELGIGSNKKLKASKIEFELARPSYTVVTLAYLQDKYPKHEFSLIMGADNLENLHKWKNFELILEHHDLYVYPRPNHDGGNLKDHPRVKWIDAPQMELSSSFIRKSIKEGKDVRYMMPETVAEYIDEMNFYRK
ncbi:MAG: nicotinate-nucleotide adenylyltransferase [Bacteroidia bacterium]|nr:nicotinate-nucleotide adenylyltransferase [Bacteroidota bacterium]MBP6513216.1 nicotinate-nucleotide adenylyltransferase [Bacteroidia bacterium]